MVEPENYVKTILMFPFKRYSREYDVVIFMWYDKFMTCFFLVSGGTGH